MCDVFEIIWIFMFAHVLQALPELVECRAANYTKYLQYSDMLVKYALNLVALSALQI